MEIHKSQYRYIYKTWQIYVQIIAITFVDQDNLQDPEQLTSALR